jgi:putative N6-adenine-specific DNA methylase
LEPLLVRELAEQGIGRPMVDVGGVVFNATTRQLYAANILCRTASKITVRLGQFRALAWHELELGLRGLPWDTVLRRDTPVRLRITSHASGLYHEDAIADRVFPVLDRLIGVIRPATDADDDQDVQEFVIRFARDVVTIAADASGVLLHRRGYRQAVAKAPLRETLAAAMVLGLEWTGQTPLIDPCCGSGTVAIEAAMVARGIAPGLERPFAFERWPSFEGGTLASVRGAARAQVRPSVAAPILASDRDAGAIDAARANAERAGVAADITFTRQAVSAIAPPAGHERGLILTNPPYGARVGAASAEADLRDLYAVLGRVSRASFPGWTVAWLGADPQLDRQLGLNEREVWRTSNGGIPIRLLAAPVRERAV